MATGITKTRGETEYVNTSYSVAHH